MTTSNLLFRFIWYIVESRICVGASVDTGVKIIEIALITLGALKIIKNKNLLVDAGIVRSVEYVNKIESISGKFIGLPNINEDVIGTT